MGLAGQALVMGIILNHLPLFLLYPLLQSWRRQLSAQLSLNSPFRQAF